MNCIGGLYTRDPATASQDRRWAGPRRRVEDLIGGKPDPEPARTPAVRR